MKKHFWDELNDHYNVAKRLDIVMLIGINYDVLFTANVYYHKACYNIFRY